MSKTIKIVILGDSTVGKTSLLIRYTKNEFYEGYVPTIYDNYSCNVRYGDETIALKLNDTAGTESYAQIRHMATENADVYLLCFAVDNLPSYQNIKDKWCKECTTINPTARIVLVGTKCDLRTDKNMEGVTYAQGKKLAEELRVPYIECSSKSGEYVIGAFNLALTEAMRKYGTSKKEKCCVLS